MAEGKEIWKDVKGYEGIYQVSSFGKVKRLARPVWNGHNYFMLKEKNLTQNPSKRGYVKITLKVNRKGYTVHVHRLVAEAFLKKDAKRNFVNHINGIRNDNRLENLEWVTPRENICHYRQSVESSSNYIGVYYDSKGKNYRANICHNGNLVDLGGFKNEKLAYQARCNYEKLNGIINKYL